MELGGVGRGLVGCAAAACPPLARSPSSMLRAMASSPATDSAMACACCSAANSAPPTLDRLRVTGHGLRVRIRVGVRRPTAARRCCR